MTWAPRHDASPGGSRVRRVFLVFPPSRFATLASDHMSTIPHGIACLAAYLRDRWDVRLLDATIEGFLRFTRVDEEIIEFGLDAADVCERIAEFQPDVVGWSCVFSHQMPFIRRASHLVRARLPDAFQVCGGNYPTFLPGRALAGSALDAIVAGEGEETLRELLDALDRGDDPTHVRGTIWPDVDGGARANPPRAALEDIAGLPWPAYDLLNMPAYFRHAFPHSYFTTTSRVMQVMSSRGCCYQCTYCSSARFWNHRLRLRNPDDVVEQIAWLVDRWGTRWIQFEDDNLTGNREHIEQICMGLIRRRVGVRWSAPNGVCVATLDAPLLALMHRAGCRDLTVAIESSSQETLRRLRKPLRVEQVAPVVREMRRLGIRVSATLIVGFHWETLEDARRTLAIATGAGLDWPMVLRANPLPGTELTRQMIRDGAIPADYDFERNSFFRSVASFPGFDSRELAAAERRTHRATLAGLYRSPLLATATLRRKVFIAARAWPAMWWRQARNRGTGPAYPGRTAP